MSESTDRNLKIQWIFVRIREWISGRRFLISVSKYTIKLTVEKIKVSNQIGFIFFYIHFWSHSEQKEKKRTENVLYF